MVREIIHHDHSSRLTANLKPPSYAQESVESRLNLRVTESASTRNPDDAQSVAQIEFTGQTKTKICFPHPE
jgi:hypothetical protein